MPRPGVIPPPVTSKYSLIFLHCGPKQTIRVPAPPQDSGVHSIPEYLIPGRQHPVQSGLFIMHLDLDTNPSLTMTAEERRQQLIIHLPYSIGGEQVSYPSREGGSGGLLLLPSRFAQQLHRRPIPAPLVNLSHIRGMTDIALPMASCTRHTSPVYLPKVSVGWRF